MDIDFVITWVDMDDPKWQAEFAKYSGNRENTKNGVSEARFRDYGFLKYWFRGVGKFAPWVRKIHFVTSSQIPQWLDADNPKIHVVNHKDYIPEQFLPTFNSVVIERYLHKIPDLAEHFVYFNDDFYIINAIGTERFFKNGLPCDIATFLYNPSWSQWYRRIKNNLKIINRHFDKKEVMSRFHDKWFDKSYGSRARWNYLLKPYGKFITLRTPYSDTKMFPLMIRPKQAVRAIYEQSYSLVCLNDNVHIRHYEQVMENIRNAFEHILPEKSEFEV